MPIDSIEQEMLSNSSNAFKISFSTHQPHANLEVLVDDVKKKQFIHGYDTSELFSACERIAALYSIEVPLSQKIFDELIALFQTVNVCVKDPNARNNSTKKRNSSLEEASLASFVPTHRR